MLKLLVNFLLFKSTLQFRNFKIENVRELYKERYWKDPYNLKCLTEFLSPTETTFDSLRLRF